MKTITLIEILAVGAALAGFRATVLGASPAANIEAKAVFPSKLEWVGTKEPPEADSLALLSAIAVFETNNLAAGQAALEQFIAAHPHSPWSPTLLTSLAEYYRAQGRYSAALDHWQTAWLETKEGKDARTQRAAARAIAGWTRLLASLGQKEQLAALLKEVDDLQLPLGPYSTIVEGTRGGLAVMNAKPGESYRCGSFALGYLAKALHLDKQVSRRLFETESPDGGFRMSQLMALAATNGISLAAVHRPAGSELVVPCVVHWKLNHYAAIVEKRGDRYLVVDPTFEGHTWMTLDVIDSETSGDFLVPAGKTPSSWSLLAERQTASLYGKGGPDDQNDPDDDPPDDCDDGDDQDATCNPPPSANDGSGSGSNSNTPPCPCGLAQWRVSEPYTTLWLQDIPLRYRLSDGQWMRFHINYKHRGEMRPANTPGFGDKWSCTWIGLMQNTPVTTPDVFTNLLAGGGVQWFGTNGMVDYKTARSLIVNPLTGLPRLASPTGSQNQYGFRLGYSSGTTNFFLTQRLDRYGRAVQFTYGMAGANALLTNVVDRDGRTNTLAYGNATYPTLITAITNPYGAVAQFTYDSGGRLTNITDMAGMNSGFQYDGDDNITNMTTPYGQTSFQFLASTNTANQMRSRGLLITEASGDQQLYTYTDNNTNTDGQMPGGWGTGDGYPQYRLSYHWNRAQYAAISPQGKTNFLAMPDADYKLASIKHWLHGFGDPSDTNNPTGYTVSDTMDSSVEAFDPVLGGRPFSQVFFWQGENAPFITNSSDGGLKRITAMVDRNGNSKVQYSRSSLGRPLVITYYSYGAGEAIAAYTNIFDSSGRYLQKELGPRGEIVRGYGYHPVITNLLTSVTNAVGDVTRWTYDTNTMAVTSITFPSGLVRTNLYYTSGPSQGFLQTQIDLQNGVPLRTNSFSYLNGNVLVQTNELGLVTTNTWDALYRLVSIAYPDGTTVSNVYQNLDVVAVKDRLNQWSHFGYDAVRQLIAATNADGQVTQYAYCGCGSQSQITRWNGTNELITYFNYGPPGYLTNVIYPDLYQVNYAYDSDGLPATITDSGGIQLTRVYAQIGQNFKLSTVSLGGQQIGSFGYDEYGRLTNSVDRNGVITAQSYDFLDRLVSRRAIDPGGGVAVGAEAFAYSPAGLTNYADPLGHATVFGRDPAGRVLYQTNANNEVLGFAYNPADEMLSLVDGKNQTNLWNYDLYGRVTNKVDAAANVLFVYQYDPLDRLTNRWSAAKGNTVYKYDPIGNLTNVVHAVSSNFVFQYDGINRLANMVDGVGATAFAWTPGNQLATEDGPWNADAVNYTYNNRLRGGMSVLAPNAGPWSQTYSYDTLARLTTVGSPAGTFGYSYLSAASDRVQYLQFHNDFSFPYVYNRFDGLARLYDTILYGASSSIADEHKYSFDAGNERTQQVFTAGNFVNYTYDRIGQLKTALGFEPSGTPATNRLQEQFGYAYDKAWNLNYRTNNALVETFNVNSLNELTTETNHGTLTVAGTATEPRAGANGVTNVTVSGTGLSSGAANLYVDGSWARAGATPVNGANTYTAMAQDTYGRQDSSSVTVNLPGTNTFAYDLNGNLLSDGTRSFAYDDENQLIAVWVTNVWQSTFAYDAMMRRRIRKEFTWSGSVWVETNEVRYVYDGNLVVQERNTNNLPSVTYTRGNDLGGTLQGAGGIGGLLARTDNGQFIAGLSSAHAYYQCDGNGNVTCMVDTNGNTVARYSYDPFGNVLTMSGPLAGVNLYRFSSKEWHLASGLVYYGRRYYGANLQRWLNRDPSAEEGGINLYAYADSDPVNEMEPDGRCPLLLAIPLALGISSETAVAVGGSVLAAGAAVAVGSALTSHGGGSGNGTGVYYSGGGGVNAPPSAIVAAAATVAAASGLPPGYWPGPAGAREWARNNGVNPGTAVGAFHDIKKGDPMSNPKDKYGVHPGTGDVVDPEGNSVGNLNDECGPSQ